MIRTLACLLSYKRIDQQSYRKKLLLMHDFNKLTVLNTPE